MKITFIMSSLWLSGGMKDIVETSNRLVTKGHAITFVIPAGTFDADMAAEIDPRIALIETRVNRQQHNNLLNMLALTWSMAKQIPKSDVIISTHTPTTPAAWIARFLLKRGELVWYYQDYIEMFIGRPLETWLTRNALRWHRGALVLSESSRLELLSFVKGKDVIVSGAGLSGSEYFHPISEDERETLKSDSNQQTILFLGDMRPRKGLYDFLEAVSIVYKECPNIFVQIVSKEDCNIKSDVPFEYIYRPTRQQLAKLYCICDLFVLASWWESFGFPPLEAMACGAPVVMTDTRGCREYTLPGKNCLLVEPQKPQVLANAILEVLTHPELAKEFRRNGPITASHFSWDKSADRFEEGLTQFLS